LGEVGNYFILGGGVIEPDCTFIGRIETVIGNFGGVEVVPAKEYKSIVFVVGKLETNYSFVPSWEGSR